jgi:acetolactate synthase-1/2/3 large subunit
VHWVRAIREGLPQDGLIVADYTQIGYVANIVLPVDRSGCIITPGYQGTLGFAFPAALGAKVAQPDRSVVAIVGDGGFMFAANELATAVKHRVGVVTILFNDSRYSNVQRLQMHAYGGRVIASDLVNPDFHTFVRSFGALAHRVNTPEALSTQLAKALKEDLPTVIEVIVPMLPDPWPYIYPADPANA